MRFKLILLESIKTIQTQIDAIKNKYDAEISRSMLKSIPDYTTDLKKAEYLKFVQREYDKGNIPSKHLKSKSEFGYDSTLKDNLALHDSKVEGHLKNILNYDDYDDMVNHLDNIPQTYLDYDNNGVTVHSHYNHKAAIKAAKLESNNIHYKELNGKAKWCISADSENGANRFNEYAGGSGFKTITDNNKGRKYALTQDYRGTTIWDEHDNKVSLKEFRRRNPLVSKHLNLDLEIK